MDSLIPTHGGFRDLITFQLARLIFDLTARFCDKFIPIGSRTRDQMVQAARSGVQNIAEGSQASGTSKKTELKVTNVARASLVELSLDYEDYLRQHNFSLWSRTDPRRQIILNSRFTNADDFVKWVQRQQGNVSENAANGILVLIGIASSLLGRQLMAQSKAFEQEGGFTERLYNRRSSLKKRPE